MRALMNANNFADIVGHAGLPAHERTALKC